MNFESMDYNYEYRQKKSGLQIGDKVKVLRKAETRENGWGTFWSSNMNKYVGKTYEIKFIDGNDGLQLDNGWWFPYFILEKQHKVNLPDKLFTMEI